MNNEDQIALQDYFDDLLSEDERNDFEDILLDNIDLAIDLGKLKDLRRNLHNLPSNFDPSETIIENIFDSLLEESEEVASIEDESEGEGENQNKSKDKSKSVPKKKREIKKKQKVLKAKTKFRLKRLLIFSTFVFFIVIIGAGYYLFQQQNSTFPWKVSVLSENVSSELQSLVSSGLNSDVHLKTSGNDIIKITIPDNGVIELSGESGIVITYGTQSLNSILLEKGNLIFTPQIGNILFQLVHNEITIESKSSQFEIMASNKKSSTLKIITNFVEIKLEDIISKIPYNHTFKILDKNNINIPLITNSSKKLANLVHQFDIEQNDKTLQSILKLSTRNNAFTLHFMLQKVTPSNREIIIEKLQQNFPLPNSITKADILMLDNSALNTWWEDIYRTM